MKATIVINEKEVVVEGTVDEVIRFVEYHTPPYEISVSNGFYFNGDCI